MRLRSSGSALFLALLSFYFSSSSAGYTEGTAVRYATTPAGTGEVPAIPSTPTGKWNNSTLTSNSSTRLIPAKATSITNICEIGIIHGNVSTITATHTSIPAAKSLHKAQTQTLTLQKTALPSASSPASSVSSSPPSPVQTHIITVGGPSGLLFSPFLLLSATPGSIVRFTFLSINHTVTQSSFLNPCIPRGAVEGGSPSALTDSGFRANPNDNDPSVIWDYEVRDLEPTWWYCKQGAAAARGGHCGKGMVFAINPRSVGEMVEFRERAAAVGTGTGSTSVPLLSSSPTNAVERVEDQAECRCRCLCPQGAFVNVPTMTGLMGVGATITSSGFMMRTTIKAERLEVAKETATVTRSVFGAENRGEGKRPATIGLNYPVFGSLRREVTVVESMGSPFPIIGDR